ncbi:MAG: hypothetical protein WD015_04685 [Gaiellaceae bacterium]
MPIEPLSPELALVDPELGARARAALPDPRSEYARPRTAPVVAASRADTAEHAAQTRPYPVWARMTAALWVLVLGILVGGTAIPHAQDRPRVVPPEEDITICERPTTTSWPAPGLSNPFGP